MRPGQPGRQDRREYEQHGADHIGPGYRQIIDQDEHRDEHEGVADRCPQKRQGGRKVQGDLAEAVGVSRQTINAIENGKYDPSLPLAFKMARLFGMRIEEIFEEQQ